MPSFNLNEHAPQFSMRIPPTEWLNHEAMSAMDEHQKITVTVDITSFVQA